MRPVINQLRMDETRIEITLFLGQPGEAGNGIAAAVFPNELSAGGEQVLALAVLDQVGHDGVKVGG